MRGLLLMLAVVLVLVSVLAASKQANNKPIDILGYKSPARHWILRENIDNVELTGMVQAGVDKGWTIIAGDVELEFNGANMPTFSTLWFHNNNLELIMINVETKEPLWKYLDDYLTGRYGKGTDLKAPYSGHSWIDNDKDRVRISHGLTDETKENASIIIATQEGWSWLFPPDKKDTSK